MSARWPRPDFLASARPRRPSIAWLWSAAALVAAALSLNDWRLAQEDLDTQRARLARATQQRSVAAVMRPGLAASASRPAAADSTRSAQAVVDRIAHPWDRLIANIETETPDGLQWLALDHDADDSAVRLEGAAGDVATVLHFVDNLADHAGWTDVVLGRLRTAEGRDAAPGAPWRFELRAGIDPRRVALARPAGDR
jgi:hypothetical protein